MAAPSAPVRRPHPATLPPSLPLSRKRGWVPSEPEVSQAATIPASSSGYLDTPAKYRDFTITPEMRTEDEVEEMVAGESDGKVVELARAVERRQARGRAGRRAMALGLGPRRRISWIISFALSAMVCLQAAAAFLVFYVLVTVSLLVLMLCILSLSHFLLPADLPPAKRRRTLAGSIVSTAVSAALIGTAVGLTVYRL